MDIEDFNKLSSTVQMSLVIAMHIRNEIENFHSECLSDEQMKKLNDRPRSLICHIQGFAFMHSVLSRVNTVYINKQNLFHLLKDESNPEQILSQMIENGDLICLKEDFFVIAKKVKEESDPLEQIANVLYEPSYVSLEWALAYYQMIPEAVFMLTSVTVNKSIRFDTPLLMFSYSSKPPRNTIYQ